jgi:predicted nucleic acid-binding protein
MTVTRGVLWDCSAILALLDANDADHGRAVQVARQIALARRPSFITNCIEVEAHALLLRKLGRMLAREWLLTGGLPVVRALPAEEERAREIIARQSDKNGSLCDAISFAVTNPCRLVDSQAVGGVSGKASRMSNSRMVRFEGRNLKPRGTVSSGALRFYINFGRSTCGFVLIQFSPELSQGKSDRSY